MKTRLFGAIVLLGATAAHAGTDFNVTISQIEIEGQGHFFVYLASTISGSPSCASLPATGFVVDGTTNAGRAVLSVIQTAYALGKTVNVYGNNQCDVHVGYETVWDVMTTN